MGTEPGVLGRIRRRERDRGHFRTNIELMIVVAIIAILAAIAIPTLLQYRAARGTNCLGHLLTLTAGTLPAATTCPHSGKPYATSPDGRVACPSPADHLDSSPRFVRGPGGAWRLEQTLPAYAGGALAIGDEDLEVRETPGQVSLLFSPGALGRYVFGPLFSLIAALLALVFLTSFLRALRKKEAGDAVGGFVCFTVCGIITAFLLAGCGSRHEYVIERHAARMTRVETVFGWTWSKASYTGCLGVVPVPVKSSGRRTLQLVHAPGVDGRRMTPIEGIPAKRLDLVDWFNRILLPKE